MEILKFTEKFIDSIDNGGTEIVFQFFISFARIECALKNSLTFATSNLPTQPNWELFLKTIKPLTDYSSNASIKKAKDYILNNPPQIQTKTATAIEWTEREFQQNEPEENKLLQHIKDVRNNLFHGGKFNGIYKIDESRNYILINSSLTILNYWITLNQNILQLFNEDIE